MFFIYKNIVANYTEIQKAWNDSSTNCRHRDRNDEDHDVIEKKLWHTCLCVLNVIDDEFFWRAQMKWLAFWKETKKISFSHVIKTYKSKLLCSLQFIFFSHFCSQHMIASSITSVVVCIIDYNNNHQDLISSALYCIARKSISFFCRFRLSVDAMKSWRQLSFIWLCKIFLSLYSIFLFHSISLYEYSSDLIHSLLDLWKFFCWLKKFFTFYYFWLEKQSQTSFLNRHSDFNSQWNYSVCVIISRVLSNWSRLHCSAHQWESAYDSDFDCQKLSIFKNTNQWFSLFISVS